MTFGCDLRSHRSVASMELETSEVSGTWSAPAPVALSSPPRPAPPRKPRYHPLAHPAGLLLLRLNNPTCWIFTLGSGRSGEERSAERREAELEPTQHSSRIHTSQEAEECIYSIDANSTTWECISDRGPRGSQCAHGMLFTRKISISVAIY